MTVGDIKICGRFLKIGDMEKIVHIYEGKGIALIYLLQNLGKKVSETKIEEITEWKHPETCMKEVISLIKNFSRYYRIEMITKDNERYYWINKRL